MMTKTDGAHTIICITNKKKTDLKGVAPLRSAYNKQH